MDYEKLHKDTITNLQEMVNSGKITVEIARKICADFVPESEDEMTRQEMLAMFSNADDYGFEKKFVKRAIAYLEKQGEQILANSVKTCKNKQKPTWSEEDEKMLDDIAIYLSRYSNYISKTHEGNAAIIHKAANWIKSLKNRIGFSAAITDPWPTATSPSLIKLE